MKSINNHISFILLVSSLFLSNYLESQILYKKDLAFFGKKLNYLEDKKSILSIDSVLNKKFYPVKSDIPSYGLSSSTFWFKIDIQNSSSLNNLFLEIAYPGITRATLYTIKKNKVTFIQRQGDSIEVSAKIYNHRNPYFTLNLSNNENEFFILQVSSINALTLPFRIGGERNLLLANQYENYFFVVYLGIIGVMFFYNFFIYISVKDNNYLYYVIYIFCVGLTQVCLKGYAQDFISANHLGKLLFLTNVSIALSGISSILFVIHFLQIKIYSKKIYLMFYFLSIILCSCIILSFAEQYILAQKVLQITSGLSALMILITGFITYKKGFKPAQFFIIAWFFFLIGVMIYILKDAGLLRFNSITDNSILIGSAIEVTLLSLALADKINIYKKEKEESQAEALKVLKENETLIREQNIVLEKKVTERTEELRATNGQLNKTLIDLKDAQAQLVDAEKMASLGQLTAGIAHEINNPINFVKSNVKPLQLDINDLFELIGKYQKLHKVPVGAEDSILKEIRSFEREIDPEYIKQEVKSLIHGIEEGANRTAEIVQGLRNFSRLDESELKTINIYEGIDSTLLLLKNALPSYIIVFKNYDAPPHVECYPSKLNQVFMNILTNSIQAINAKEKKSEESITISVKEMDNTSLQISIKDTGIGMTEATKHKVFEPFFTTKDVGEGTGLGMSIVFKIIEKHHAKINIVSSLGNGAEFIITLPYTQPIS